MTIRQIESPRLVQLALFALLCNWALPQRVEAVPDLPPGSVTFSVDVQPAVGLPGFSIHTLSAETDLGTIRGFDVGFGDDFSKLNKDNGIFGPLNQNTVLQDESVFRSDLDCLVCNLAAGTVENDSHFLFRREELLILAAAETDEYLRAVFVFSTTNGPGAVRDVPLPFAQVVIPDVLAEDVTLKGEVAVRVASGELLSAAIEGVIAPATVPEPSGILLLLTLFYIATSKPHRTILRTGLVA